MTPYHIKLDEEIKEINDNHPYVDEIVKAIHTVDCMSNYEFDYTSERTLLKYNKILEILMNHQLVK